MARSDTTRQALIVLSVYKRIPTQSWATVKQIQECLAADGIEVSLRSLQRILKDLAKSRDFDVLVNAKAKPYGYRREPADSAPSVNSADSDFGLQAD